MNTRFGECAERHTACRRSWCPTSQPRRCEQKTVIQCPLTANLTGSEEPSTVISITSNLSFLGLCLDTLNLVGDITPQPTWTPPPANATNLDASHHYVNRIYDLELSSSSDIHTWSVADIPTVAEATFYLAGIKTPKPYVRHGRESG